MKTLNTQRELALYWWKQQSDESKDFLMYKYDVVAANERTPNQLTGFEIQKIWYKHTQIKLNKC